MGFWRFIKNAVAPDEEEQVELRIEGDIVSSDDAWLYEWFGIPATSPNAFRAALAEHAGKNITVWVDSYGGDVFAAAGIYNALKEHKGKVTVKIDGKAMSAASVIAMAGNTIAMSPVGQMMIHNPSSYAAGDAREMRHVADVLESVKQSIINAYQLKTGKSRAKISEMMDAETFMDAKKALADGFIDEMLYANEEAGAQIANAFRARQLAVQNAASDSLRGFLQRTKETPAPPAPEPPLNTYRAKLDNLRRMKDEL